MIDLIRGKLAIDKIEDRATGREKDIARIISKEYADKKIDQILGIFVRELRNLLMPAFYF